MIGTLKLNIQNKGKPDDYIIFAVGEAFVSKQCATTTAAVREENSNSGKKTSSEL